MAFKLIEAAQGRWRCVNGSQLVALVRAGAKFEKRVMIERPNQQGQEAAADQAGKFDPQVDYFSTLCGITASPLSEERNLRALSSSRGCRRGRSGERREPLVLKYDSVIHQLQCVLSEVARGATGDREAGAVRWSETE